MNNVAECSNNAKANQGYCIICNKETRFIEYGPWKRDDYRCHRCNSIPRQRALICALNLFYADWPKLVIHESSPCGPSSNFLRDNCKSYSASHYFQDIPAGKYKGGYRCENLEKMTFPSASFDLFITQDVFEHVMRPEVAFAEIARVLKTSGSHVFTLPWYKDKKKSTKRVCMENGEIVNLEPPIYHGNPIDKAGSLVTYDFGMDLFDCINKSSGLNSIVYLHEDRKLGLDAEFMEVFISYKSH